MNQPVLMKVFQSGAQRHADADAFIQWQPRLPAHFAPQGPRSILFRNKGAAGMLVVGKLHYVKEEAIMIIATDLKNAKLAIVRARQGRKLLNAIEFALVRTIVVEALAPDDLRRAEG